MKGCMETSEKVADFFNSHLICRVQNYIETRTDDLREKYLHSPFRQSELRHTWARKTFIQ